MRSVSLEKSSPVLRRESYAALLNVPGFGIDNTLNLGQFLSIHGDKPWSEINRDIDNYYSRVRWNFITNLAKPHSGFYQHSYVPDGLTGWGALHFVTEYTSRPVISINDNRHWVDIRRAVKERLQREFDALGMDAEIADQLYRASNWTTKHLQTQRVPESSGAVLGYRYPYSQNESSYYFRHRYVGAYRRLVIA